MQPRVIIPNGLLTLTIYMDFIEPVMWWFQKQGMREGRDWWFDFSPIDVPLANAVFFTDRRAAQLFKLTWCTFPL